MSGQRRSTTARVLRPVVCAISMFGLVALPDPAAAAIYGQTPGTSSARQESGADWAVTVTATLSAADDAAGYCVDSFFDWQALDVDGRVVHYDARIVRNCDVGVLSRSKWVNDLTGLTNGGTRKAGSCLVTGTNPAGLWGTRVGCEIEVGRSVASCGTASAACYIRKNGVITKTGWNFPKSATV